MHLCMYMHMCKHVAAEHTSHVVHVHTVQARGRGAHVTCCACMHVCTYCMYILCRHVAAEHTSAARRDSVAHHSGQAGSAE